MTDVREHPEEAGDRPQDCGAFFLDAVGPFARDQVRLIWEELPRPAVPPVEQAIATVWQERLSQAAHNGTIVIDRPLCRLLRYSANSGNLSLALGPTNYRDFLGTNLHNAYFRYIHGPEVLANPVGVSAILLAEGYILLGRRSGKVAYHAGRIHMFGGCMELQANGQPPDPFDFLWQEVREELGVAQDRLAEPLCLGLVRDKHIVQPELVFSLQVHCSADEIRSSQSSAEHTVEHADLVAVRSHPASVVTFIQTHYSQLTPACLAGLLLLGLSNWGSGWFASTRGYLRSLI